MSSDDLFSDWASPELVQSAEHFVQQHLREHDFDSSHDWCLSKEDAVQAYTQGKELEQETAAIGVARVHDWKYSGCDKAGVSAVTSWLEDQNAVVSYVVANIGFKESLSLSPGGSPPPPPCPEAHQLLAIVQDADRLDAIGAIGVARCLTFGGNFKRTLHDPAVPPRDALSKEEYMSGAVQQTTINHFYEKLLKLQALMNTETARRLAAKRTRSMQAFLDDFFAEWDLADVPEDVAGVEGAVDPY